MPPREIPPPAEEPSRFRRGVELLNARKPARARRELARAVGEDGRDQPWAVQEYLQTFLRSGKAAEAEEHFRKLLPEDSVLFQHGLAYLYRLTGRVPQAVELLEAALKRRPKQWAVNNELGWLRCVTGDVPGGLKLLKAATRRFEKAGDTWGLAISLTHRGAVAMLRWDLLEASATYERALAMKRVSGERIGLATCLYQLAYIRWLCADHVRARALAEEALAEQRHLGFARGAAFSLNLLGLCHVELCDAVAARKAFREALRMQRKAGLTANADNEGATRGNLCWVALLDDRPSEALKHGHEALRALGANGDEHLICLAIGNMARALGELGRPRESLELALQYLGERSWGPRARVDLHREEARARLALGDLESAARAAKLALAAGRSMPAPLRAFMLPLMLARVLLGRTLAASGRTSQAARTLSRASEEVEELLRLQCASTARMGLLERYREVTDARMECALLRQGGVEKAWSLSRGMKARELLSTMATLQAGKGRSGEDELSELSALEAHLEHVGRGSALSALERKNLHRLVKRHAELAHGHRLPAALPNPESEPTWTPPDGAALIEYHVGVETTWAFCAFDDEILARDLQLPQRKIASLVRSLLRPIHSAAASRDPINDLESFDLSLAHRAFRRLLEPVLSQLPEHVGRLTVVPDGPLHELPFELLVQGLPSASTTFASYFGSARHVADTHLVSYVPSSQLLVHERRRRTPRRAFVLAHSPRSDSAVDFPDGPRDLEALPHVAREARDVERLFREARVALGAEATPARYARDARWADVIHVAAHGRADARAAGLSGLVVAGREGHSQFLSAEAIATTPVEADVVTLSACETARGRLQRHEGVIGLSRAFLVAGARSLVASHWKVDDEATRTLMRSFHSEITAGADRADALARARGVLRSRRGSSELHAHPYYWAAFTLADRAP